MTKKQKIKRVLLIVLLLSFVPFPTTVVSKWKIKVVDENGQPYKNQLVRQFCDNYTLGVSPCDGNDSMKKTNNEGFVTFPKRIIWMSFSMRIVWTVFNYLNLFVHGSVGTEVYLDSSGKGGYKVLKYNPQEPLPKEFILPSN